MDCQDYRQWLSPYLDGALETARRAELEQHLGRCPTCGSELDCLKQLLASFKGLKAVEAPRDLLAGVHEKLAVKPRWKPLLAWWPLPRLQHSLALAVTVLLVFLVATPLYLQHALPGRLRLAGTLNKQTVADRKSTREADRSAVGERRKQVSSSEFLSAMAPRLPQAPVAKIAERQRPGEGGDSDVFFSEAGRANDHDRLIRWAVPDRVQATVQLHGWLSPIPGATMTTHGDRLIVRLPASRYPTLLAALQTYGHLASEQETGQKAEANVKADELAATSSVSGTSGVSPAARPVESLLVIELQLVPSE